MQGLTYGWVYIASTLYLPLFTDRHAWLNFPILENRPQLHDVSHVTHCSIVINCPNNFEFTGCRMRKSTILLVIGCMVTSVIATAQAQTGMDLPPADAKPGECYAKVLVPSRYEVQQQRVMTRPETRRSRKVEAEYETVEQSVLIQDAAFEFVPVPPRFEMREERILISPERTEQVIIPAKYESVTERIMTSPARFEWKPGRGALERVDDATGEIMCRVEIPAKFRTVTKQRLIEPERVEQRTIPARYRTVEKRVLVQEAGFERREIPAKFETISYRREIKPESTELETVPAVFETVDKRVKVSDEGMQWRQILCETNTSAAVIRRIQTALLNEGYDPGPLDGEWGLKTRRAIYAYQRKKGLPTGGLTLATIESLGIKL